MRRLFFAATLLFWTAVAAFWFDSLRAPPPTQMDGPSSIRALGMTELAEHASTDDCWMAIDGYVYNVTPYLPEHPSRPAVIIPWCGREASEAYRTKSKGKPHSPEADALLQSFKIGRFEN